MSWSRTPQLLILKLVFQCINSCFASFGFLWVTYVFFYWVKWASLVELCLLCSYFWVNSWDHPCFFTFFIPRISLFCCYSFRHLFPWFLDISSGLLFLKCTFGFTNFSFVDPKSGDTSTLSIEVIGDQKSSLKQWLYTLSSL